MQKNKVIELLRGDNFPGLTCSRCGLHMVNRSAMGRVMLADAELLFCSSCGQHLASILDPEERARPRVKSA